LTSAAGLLLRGERADGESVRSCADKILRQAEISGSALRVASIFARYAATDRFVDLLAEL